MVCSNHLSSVEDPNALARRSSRMLAALHIPPRASNTSSSYHQPTRHGRCASLVVVPTHTRNATYDAETRRGTRTVKGRTRVYGARQGSTLAREGEAAIITMSDVQMNDKMETLGFRASPSVSLCVQFQPAYVSAPLRPPMDKSGVAHEPRAEPFVPFLEKNARAIELTLIE